MAKTNKPNPPKKKSPKAPAAKAAHPPAVPAAAGKSKAKPSAPAVSVPVERPSKKTALRDSILARKAATKPIAFSLDEVRAIAKVVTAKAEATSKSAKVTAKPSAALQAAALEKPTKPNHIKAASLADILGFNPKRTKAADVIEVHNVPEKYKRYYKLLIDLRKHLTEGIERHSEETLKRSSKDDSGDLSAYGQHMADAGTDTFDRDFALSLVSSEQEALSEIEAAIKRVRDGTYGICEITAKPISKERLLAVPFTRYSAEAQKQIERNRHHSRSEAGLFGESGEEGGTIAHDDGGDE
jgi:RNA polymerase-binding transcription factor DksA